MRSRSKLAPVMHALDLAEELEATGMKVNSLHPAALLDTPTPKRTTRRPERPSEV